MASSRGATAPAVLTIDLDAVVANWRQLDERTAPGRCAAVVKADAYGLGAARVAPALHAAGCRTFFVAQLEEALALRAVLPDAEILSLGGLPSGSTARSAMASSGCATAKVRQPAADRAGATRDAPNP